MLKEAAATPEEKEKMCYQEQGQAHTTRLCQKERGGKAVLLIRCCNGG